MSALFEVLKRLELEDRKQREAGLPPEQRNRSITRTTGQILSMLVRLSKATHVIEIGTSIGYSTLWLALGVKTTHGTVISYEIETARVAQARSNVEQAGLSEVVEVRNEDPRKVELPETDFVFLDAEKRDYIEHFKAIFPKMLPAFSIL
ncbi:MAG: O-methyltransferase [Candidatus Hermodarchaeota archaeon]